MFKLDFETENAAFEDAPAAECARILRGIASHLEREIDVYSSPIFDANGNRVGHWEMTPYSTT